MNWQRIAQLTVAGVLLLWGALLLPTVARGWFGQHPGWDYDHYMTAARLWLDGGNPYAGPALTGYVRPGPETMPFLHPPLALPLFAAFSFLPWWAWWAVPLGIVGWCLASWRPSGWWAVAALACAVVPRTPEMLLIGNSDMWVAAGLAAGLRFGWPAALVLLKPSMGPFALVGARRRSWWLALVVMAVLAVPFGLLWLDWWTVVRNTAVPLTYSLEGIPLPLVVLFGWLSRARAPGARRSGRSGSGFRLLPAGWPSSPARSQGSGSETT